MVSTEALIFSESYLIWSHWAIFHDSSTEGNQWEPSIKCAKELKNLDEPPPEGIKVTVNDDDFTTIFADIEGPGKRIS
jgi:hypothetical protein